MIPPDHKQDIVQSGINFLRSITDAYGADEGMKLWATIADTIDSDIKGAIFFAMLTGDYSGVISVNGKTPSANKVAMIKAIRSVDSRNLGLKEAKDLSDAVDVGKIIKLQVEPSRRSSALQELRHAGFYV